MFIWKPKSVWRRDAVCSDADGNILCRYRQRGKWYKPQYFIERNEDQWELRSEGLGGLERIYLWDVPIGEFKHKLSNRYPIQVGTHHYIWKISSLLKYHFQILDVEEDVVLMEFRVRFNWRGASTMEVDVHPETQNLVEFGLLLGLGYHLYNRMEEGAAVAAV